jgi:hypothetical protein
VPVPTLNQQSIASAMQASSGPVRLPEDNSMTCSVIASGGFTIKVTFATRDLRPTPKMLIS